MEETLSLADLKDALKETLEARGTLGPIKARLRAEIFQALDEGATKPKLSNENLIINELIREYLEYNGYRHTLSVFLPESGQPQERPFQRRFLAHELNITEDPRYNQVPLLYGIVTALQDAKASNQGDGSRNPATLRPSSTPPMEPSPQRLPASAVPAPASYFNSVKDAPATADSVVPASALSLETQPPLQRTLSFPCTDG
ncbi:hypothetical protein ACHHYP_14922 [Achlya hypogyna]|uniref:Centrosomal protein 20 n=1 Tax=Achlya hypogyna TaxID=1202772 RepID=A0A1V9YC06_ACHHY|nr:hypothetical protein ACHHYP_14922 [Achlya hypogyna]